MVKLNASVKYSSSKNTWVKLNTVITLTFMINWADQYHALPLLINIEKGKKQIHESNIICEGRFLKLKQLSTFQFKVFTSDSPTCSLVLVRQASPYGVHILVRHICKASDK